MLDTTYQYRILRCEECDTKFAGLEDFKCVICGTEYPDDKQGVYSTAEAADAYRIYEASIKPNLERD